MSIEQINNLILTILIVSTPLIAGAIGGMYSEKSGIVNIGLEGIMTFAAFTCSVGILFVENTMGITGFFALMVGTIFGIIGGTLFAAVHGMFTIKFKMDQIISGTIINMVALGLAIFLTKGISNGSSSTAFKKSFALTIFNIPLIVILIFLLIPLSIYVINYTRWGLRLRACGENPQAAKSKGINVSKIRFQAVLLSGVAGALGGVALVILFSGNFSPSTVAGKGFIALAVLIFGRWKPVGILLSGLLFGFLSSLGVTASILFTGEHHIPMILLILLMIVFGASIYFIKNGIIKVLSSTVIYFVLLMIFFTNQSIPGVYYDILPYVITIVALIYYSKDADAPGALGEVF